MNNYQLRNVRAVAKELKDKISDLDFIGFAHNSKDFTVFKSKKRAALVQLMDSNLHTRQQNLSVWKDVDIKILLLFQSNQKELESITDLQNSIEDTLLDKTFQDAQRQYLDCINWISINRGDNLPDFDFRAAGFRDNKTLCYINFRLVFRSPR